MKKSLFTLLFAVILVYGRSQCVISCSNYAVSSIAYSVFPNGGTDVTNNFLPSKDDGATSAVPIGFSFDFYCTTYTNVFICSNGFIQFTPVSWAHGNYVHPTAAIPAPAEPNNQVAFNQCDLDPTPGGSITYNTLGTSPNRIFVVTYSNVPNFGQSSLNTGQIVLYETSNNIEIYTTAAFGTTAQAQSGTGSQGIENLYGNNGVPVTGRSNSSSWYPGTNTAYRFQYDYAPKAPAKILGDTLMCIGSTASYSINAIPTSTAYNWTIPAGWNGTPSGSSGTYTISNGGVISVSASYSCGTSPTTTLAVNLLPLPVVGILSATPSVFCSGGQVTISVTGADTYTMEPGNITGQNPFTDMPLTNTIYSISGTSTAGCISAKPSTVLVTVNTTPTVSINSGQVCSGAAFNFTASGANSYVYETGFATVTQTVPGLYSYTVVGTVGNCKSAPATSSLLVHPLPTITAVASRSVICKGESSILTAGGGTAYVWTHTTSATNTVLVKPVTVTGYSVTGTDINGCVNGKAVSVNVNPCLGVNENGQTGKFLSVYPNPSNDVYTIETSATIEYVIYDITGKIVQSGKIDADNKKVIAQDLAPGQYMLRAFSETSQESLLLIKK